MVINTNNSASTAYYSSNQSSRQLYQNLASLSSGSRLTNSSVDAGGLAVSLQLGSQMGRTQATSSNIQNSMSFLQTQDGALKTAGAIMNRMSDLKIMSSDFTKNESDLAGYDAEFAELSKELEKLQGETFNGVNLFSEQDGQLTVSTNESGGAQVTVSQADFNASGTAVNTVTSATSLSDVSVDDFKNAIDEIAVQRAVKGSQQSRLLFANDVLYTNLVNLGAANSRIADTDFISASTNYATNTYQYRSNLSMLAQANATQDSVLSLIA